jgi:hypothetical protein
MGAEQGPGGEELTPEQAAAMQGQMMGGAPTDAGMNGTGEQVMTPPEAQAGGLANPFLAQTMVKDGEPSNRLMMQQELGGIGGPGAPAEEEEEV